MAPVAVGVTHRQPADLAEYERRLGARIAFNQPVNSITLSGPTLSLPMPQADPQLFKLVTRYLRGAARAAESRRPSAQSYPRSDDPLPAARQLTAPNALPTSSASRRAACIAVSRRKNTTLSAPARRHKALPDPTLSERDLAEADRHRREGRLFRAQRLQPRGATLVRHEPPLLPAAARLISTSGRPAPRPSSRICE